MVVLALLLGVYANLIFGLGSVGWLENLPVFLATFLIVVVGLVYYLKENGWPKLNFGYFQDLKRDRVALVCFIIFIAQVGINFLGAISPELSFDALWYHLTSAKLFVQNHRIYYLQGNLLWPANTPKLGDIYYAVALLFSNEIVAKLIHFAFGILSAVALFNLLRRYFNIRNSFLGVVTFYTMLIVGWQSTTAYVDLTRTFFEILALDYFLRWIEYKKDSFLFEAAVLTGLAVSTKIMALASLLIFLILIVVVHRKGWWKQGAIFGFLVFLIASPWFFFSFLHTGNPLYPFLGNFQNPQWNENIQDVPFLKGFVLGPIQLWQDTFKGDSIISLIYLLFLPLVLVFVWKQKFVFKIAALYTFLAFEFSLGYSNRYILPYLPAFTLVILTVFESRWVQEKMHQRFLMTLILISAFLNLGSRTIATRKFTPYLLGRENKDEFLTKNLNFAFGDFYDIDGWFARNIKEDDLVLVYGIHNLYYLNFPYLHESQAKPETVFTHILVGSNQKLPEKFGRRLLLYENPQTQAKVYLFGEKYQ